MDVGESDGKRRDFTILTFHCAFFQFTVW